MAFIGGSQETTFRVDFRYFVIIATGESILIKVCVHTKDPSFMTLLLFLLLKSSNIWETEYDYVIALILLALDVIGVAEWYRIVLHKRGR